ncbi:TetR/AcrR family transcriptional regulator, partial [Streptomyces alkaliphilus]|uniref:TetR/AcrR family transcriptional regulator n=1 Tax=Streptomyces alkaliphilus TaxID=1472722 RepID=UPI00117E1EE2
MTDDTRTRLVETARALIHGSSFAEVGISDLCREAGVHRGSLYHFFPSKDAVGLAVVDANWELLKALLDESFDSEAPPLERINAFIDGFAGMLTAARDRMGSVPGCPLGNLALELSGRSADASRRIAEILTAWQRYFRDAIGEAAAQGSHPGRRGSRRGRPARAGISPGHHPHGEGPRQADTRRRGEDGDPDPDRNPRPLT